jgi:hypothetical protein
MPSFIWFPNLKLYSPLVCSEGHRNGNRSQAILWSGNGTTRALIRGATRTLARVFEI